MAMDCLICNILHFNDLTNDPKLFSTFCKLLDIPIVTLTGNPKSICPSCSEKLVKIHELFDQLESIKAQLDEFKREIMNDLVKGHRSSGGNPERSKIVQEIMTKVGQGQQGQNLCSEESSFLDNSDDFDDIPISNITTTTTPKIKSLSSILKRSKPKPSAALLKSPSCNIDDPTKNPDEIKLLMEQQGQNLCSKESPFLDNSDSFDSIPTSNITTTTKIKSLSSILKRSKPKPSAASLKSPSCSTNDPTENTNEIKVVPEPPVFQQRFKSLSDCFKKTNLYKRKTTTIESDKIPLPVERNEQQVTKRKCRESNDGGHLCSDCGKIFKKESILVEHLRTHTHTEEHSDICHVCGLVFKTKSAFRNHQVVHGIGKSALKCSICDRYVMRYKFKDHMESHEGVKKRPFLCSQCPLAFLQKRNLDEHIQSVHLNEKFNCDQCDKSYYNKNSLKSHILEVHEKRFTVPCPECPMFFSSGSRLSRHRRRVHIKSKLVKCTFCDKSFYDHNLKNHIKRMHQSFKCTIPDCKSQSFMNKYRLDRHMELFHPNQNPNGSASDCNKD